MILLFKQLMHFRSVRLAVQVEIKVITNTAMIFIALSELGMCTFHYKNNAYCFSNVIKYLFNVPEFNCSALSQHKQRGSNPGERIIIITQTINDKLKTQTKSKLNSL